MNAIIDTIQPMIDRVNMSDVVKVTDFIGDFFDTDEFNDDEQLAIRGIAMKLLTDLDVDTCLFTKDGRQCKNDNIMNRSNIAIFIALFALAAVTIMFIMMINRN